ncbi:MAG: hypothetical protein ABS42_00130 [Bdellovibrio sp. SCN 50-8]|nr:MAG: hypothetical protein ABS42_00130 [Bdellovibrio sp. SCN 50-8]
MSQTRPSRLSFLSLIASSGLLILAGCSSTNHQREEARNKVVQNAKLYCEFVNGDDNRDIDVAVNLAIGSKCDPDRALTMTSYRTPSDINGVLYCCGVREVKNESRRQTEAPKAAAKAVEAAPAVTAPVAVAPAVAPAPAAPAAAATDAKVEAPVDARKPNSYRYDPDLDE